MKREVIIACDFSESEQLLKFLSKFPEKNLFLKIGMELFYSQGPMIIEKLRNAGYRIFLDLKLLDIPNTVKKATKNIAKLDVDMITIHASGGKEMMSAAIEGADTCGNKMKILAVTVLTSISEKIFKNEILIDIPLRDAVTQYAKNAKSSGVAGVVCSPFESRIVKTECGNDFLVATPGIRYSSNNKSKNYDQNRVTTPKEAKKFGGDFIIVGRPITLSDDPNLAYEKFIRDFILD